METLGNRNEIIGFENDSIKTQVKDILVQHGLDFRIEKVQLNANFGGVEYPSEYYGLLNTKTGEIINSVKNSYHVSQNDEVMELVVRGMQGFGELSVQKAGSLHGGRKTFIQLGIDGNSIVGDDTIKKYITCIDSNDGSTGLSIGISNMVMSCQNQYFKFYRMGEVKMKHSSSLGGRMVEIPQLIKLALNESMKQIEIYNKFASTSCSRSLLDGLVKEVIGFNKHNYKDEDRSSKSLNAMDSLYTCMDSEMKQKGDNLFGLFNGVTYWTNHIKTHPKRENGQLESIMVGTNYATNQLAHSFCLDVIG